MVNNEDKKKSSENSSEEENSLGQETPQENQEAAANGESAQEASSEAEEFKKQVEKMHTDMLYLKADFENYKKRMIRERSDYMKYGAENLIVALLDLLDNFERAMSIEMKPENLKSFADGMEMIASQFKNTLNRFGVSEIKAEGEAFDPTYHEAMGSEPTAKHKPGTITQVFTKPYKLHDRVIRHGKVIVAEAPKAEEQNGEDN